jgi:hypothetical protein
VVYTSMTVEIDCTFRATGGRHSLCVWVKIEVLMAIVLRKSGRIGFAGNREEGKGQEEEEQK